MGRNGNPIPVYGILNRRPNGPCFDTDVDLHIVEKGMRAFLGEETGRGKERTGEISPQSF